MAKVLIPGSFDPVHLGHLDVIESARELFGEVVVVVMYNPQKPSGLFSADERADLLRSALADSGGVQVQVHTGLAVQAATDVGADFIVKGLRGPADFDIEQQMAHNNQQLTGVRTVYLPCRVDLGHISSRFIREIAANGVDVGHLVPDVVAVALADRFSHVLGTGENP
jgi:pantetheine-phosphate adenylyltransferase